MARVCPWWLGYFLINPFRRWRQDPGKILAPHVREGMTVLEPGPGMGFFTLELAKRVGPAGRVIAIDIQIKMLEKLKRRAARHGVLERIETRLAAPESMAIGDLNGKIDFAFAFAVIHELPPNAAVFPEIAAALKPGGRLLVAEPRGHVKAADFEAELAAAAQAGLTVIERPSIAGSHTALFKK